MIIFGNLTFRNFLAVGDKPTTIDLNSGRLSLITGMNGSGKSTIIDALVYVLFGTAHRLKMTLPSMVNEINKNKMIVSLELNNGKDDYKIIRGEKPKKFELYKNNKKMDKFSTSDLMNKYIIANVIGQDKDIFLQLTVISKSNYDPPLELSASKRREFVEKMFNIFILSKMKDILKDTTRESNNKKNELTVCIDKKTLEIEYAKKLINSAKEARDGQIEIIESEISDFESEILLFEEQHRKLKFDKILYSDLVESLKDKKDLKRTLNRDLWGLESNLERQKGIRSSIDDISSVCISCGQEITNVDHTLQKNIIDTDIINLGMSIGEIKGTILSEKLELALIENLIDECGQIKLEKDSILTQIRIHTRNLCTRKEQYDKLLIPIIVDVNLEELILQLEDLEDKREIYVERLIYFKYFKDDFLADTGYKAFILSRYFPEITKAVNALLLDYDLKYSVDISEDFTFKIFNLKGKEIPYARFSEGQKQRINLSVWEAFIAVAKARRNIQTNLIIFDEILDGSLDIDGQDVFLQSLQNKIEKYRMTGFIISCHGMDNFENNIKVSMINGFSHYELEEV